ncbi:MAG: zf-HC2 domain-containing protein [Terriglobales bacterium]
MPAELHPDANIISAYVEGGLSAGARRSLEAHLAACTPCRDLAAGASLALGSPVSASPVRLTWRAPLALAASAILVAGAWWLLPRTPAQARPAASLMQATPRRIPIVRILPVPAFASTVTTSAAVPAQWAEIPEPPPALSAPATPAPPLEAPASPLDFAALRHGFQSQTPAQNIPSSLVDWGGVSSPLALTASAAVAAKLVTTSPSQAAALPSLGPENAWPLASGFASAGTSAASAVPAPYSPQLAAELGWAISRGGALLRAVTTGFWRAVPFVPGVHVKVIYVRGGHVWAGGNADELFTSTDHGKHWQRVVLPNLPPHPIVLRTIVFLDTQHGMITAQDGQSWTTSDGGQNWVPR